MKRWTTVRDADAGPLGGGGGEGGRPDAGAGRRGASVTFRAGGDESSPGAMLDPANQSLADALRVMMRLLQGAMIILIGLYALSGFQSIREGERGIRLLFGRVQSGNLEPGFQWSAPYPLGEMIKVHRGVREIQIDRPFWVFLQQGAAVATLDNLTPTQSLKPDQGGAWPTRRGAGNVITGDLNIAHTQWKVGYRREDASLYAQNILPSADVEVGTTAVMRGVVQACAGVTIDELLAKSTRDGRSIEGMVKQVAQASLDRIGSGLVIEQLAMTNVIPPVLLRSDFDAAQAAVARLGTAREQALRDAARTVNAVAGPAAAVLVGSITGGGTGLIDQYEKALEAGREAEAAAILAEIDAVLMGRSEQHREAPVSGRVAQIISDAEAYRTEVVSQRRADLANFQAKLVQFRANPSLMIQREWGSAVSAFYAQPTTEVMLAPPGTELLNLMINRDPAITRDRDIARRRREGEDTRRLREEQMRQQRFETETLQLVPG